MGGFLRLAVVVVVGVVEIVAVVVTAAVLPLGMVIEGAAQVGVWTSLALAPLTEQAKVIAPLNPPAGVTVRVEVVVPPAAMDAGLAAEAVKVKAPLTVTVIEVEVENS